MKKEEFNGYSFLEPKSAKKMRYLIVYDGDLDLNGCYGFTNKKELTQYLEESYKDVSVFKVSFVAKFRGKN